MPVRVTMPSVGLGYALREPSSTRALPTVFLVTVMVQVAVRPPSAVVTVITAVPSDTAVTTPDDDTVATAVLLLTHVTLLYVAFDGEIVTDSVAVLPCSIESVVRLSDTLVTDTVGVGGVGGVGGGTTTTVHRAWRVLSAVTVIGKPIDVPPVAAVNQPLKV